jgi:hypothetical protein
MGAENLTSAHTRAGVKHVECWSFGRLAGRRASATGEAEAKLPSNVMEVGHGWYVTQFKYSARLV